MGKEYPLATSCCLKSECFFKDLTTTPSYCLKRILFVLLHTQYVHTLQLHPQGPAGDQSCCNECDSTRRCLVCVPHGLSLKGLPTGNRLVCTVYLLWSLARCISSEPRRTSSTLRCLLVAPAAACHVELQRRLALALAVHLYYTFCQLLHVLYVL